MATLFVDQQQVRRLLPMAECIEVEAKALEALARGDAVQPLRSITWLPDRSGLLGLMPACLGQPATLGVKVVTFFPANQGTELDSHQGVVMVFSPTDGRLLAVMEASEITAIRTAAVSGVATRHLALPEARTLALLGTGTQARTHLEAMLLVRPIERVLVWSPRSELAQNFAQRAAKRHGITVEAAGDAEAAVREAQVICTVTAAETPILHGTWLCPGAHVNAVGACLPHNRELDTEAVKRSRLIVDRRESALAEAGDVLIPIAEGAFGPEHIAGELGEVLAGQVEGRTSPDETTLFKSLGLAVEDVAAAQWIYGKADGEGCTALELGGRRHEAS
jgi:ornithine cyclodeaminase